MLSDRLANISEDVVVLEGVRQKTLRFPEWFYEQPDLVEVVAGIVRTAVLEQPRDGEYGTISVSTTTGLKLSFGWRPQRKNSNSLILEWNPNQDEKLAVLTYERAKQFYDEPVAVVA